MVPHHAPALNRARPRLGFMSAQALRLGAPAPQNMTLVLAKLKDSAELGGVDG
ncbi:hypothetical protein [Acetobacter tropicalis]|uniref:Uncharacterized protein n=1 Tax=Acetobacter tropicalis TaxID=104102 RepID=A0A095AYW6_9PROT|nr:hypothetical protein [Acetobacter tropicalis]KGB21938.1 hypothetical protein AtDm6_2704 [Acetobacter tropicalis]MDO8173222.1 hypothetical protein [Acetobacter tropicalis]